MGHSIGPLQANASHDGSQDHVVNSQRHSQGIKVHEASQTLKEYNRGTSMAFNFHVQKSHSNIHTSPKGSNYELQNTGTIIN